MTEYQLGNVWHTDGHILVLRLQGAELQVLETICPETDECKHRQVPCIVQHFVGRFGMECNVGAGDPTPRLPIAWTLAGDPDDIDQSQVWILPANDEAFAAWVNSQLT